MIAAKPLQLPQYVGKYGAAFPRSEATKFKQPHWSYSVNIERRDSTVLNTNMLDLLGQRNQLDQGLPSMRMPFHKRHALSKLTGFSGFYGNKTGYHGITSQSGKPLKAQEGLGAYGFVHDISPRDALVNTNRNSFDYGQF
jgi:hypothetical protein